MIIAEQKKLEQILEMIADASRIVLAGCRGCVTVCSSGGEKEVGILASTLRLAREKAGKPIEIMEVAVERQCDPEYLDEMRPYIGEYDGLLSIACGAGVQFAAERFTRTPVWPGLNTNFIGVTEKQGYWTERCQACGDCVLHLTGGICPVTRCSKSLFNGPCGGSVNGKCEINKDVDCGWQLIYDRLKALDKLDSLEKIIEPKNWSSSRDGGPRKIIREDLEI
jgi:ferredoxin